MKTPVGTEVDLGPDHTILDGILAVRERGTAAPIFSAHVYCGHGRPSQLLVSSCKKFHTEMVKVKGLQVCLAKLKPLYTI